eukprot:TRINITY_DN28785_c1_g1_i1.p1 TRINITY_DN28785_c1_g1~~TRINITY_DN28785_c1_g1_i1.p1  ORF type:complete len:667 (+),score=148.97 TRINITY_DN28785_c1_g1_i1:33-2033(+)
MGCCNGKDAPPARGQHPEVGRASSPRRKPLSNGDNAGNNEPISMHRNHHHAASATPVNMNHSHRGTAAGQSASPADSRYTLASPPNATGDDRSSLARSFDRSLTLPQGMSSAGHEKILSWLMSTQEVKRETYGWVNQHHSQHPATQNFDMAEMQQLKRNWGQPADAAASSRESGIICTPTSASRVQARPDHPTLVKAVKSYDTIKLMYPESDILWITLEVIVKGMCSAENRLQFMAGVLQAYLGNDPTALSSSKALVSQLEADCFDEEEFAVSHRLVTLVKDLYLIPMLAQGKPGGAMWQKRAQQIQPFIDQDFSDLVADALDDIAFSRRGSGKNPAQSTSSYSLSQRSCAPPNLTPTSRRDAQGVASPTFFSSPAVAPSSSRRERLPGDSFFRSTGDLDLGPAPAAAPNALTFGIPYPKSARVPFDSVKTWQKRIIAQTSPGLFDIDEAPVITVPSSEWEDIEFKEKLGPTMADVGFEIRGLSADSTVVFPPEVVRLPVELITDVLSGVTAGSYEESCHEEGGKPVSLDITPAGVFQNGSPLKGAVELKLDPLHDERLYLHGGDSPLLLWASPHVRNVLCLLYRVHEAIRSPKAFQVLGGTFVSKYPAKLAAQEAAGEANFQLISKALSLHTDHPIPKEVAVLASLKYEWSTNQTLADRVQGSQF